MNYINSNQVKIIQIAKRKVEKLSQGVFDESSYQTLLRNCGVAPDPETGRCSSKKLTQAGFEKFLATLEGMGYRTGEDDHHWRNRNSARTGLANSRQVHLIKQLAPQQQYSMASLCLSVSNNTHSEPEKLTLGQARKLIEGLKKIIERTKENT